MFLAPNYRGEFLNQLPRLPDNARRPLCIVCLRKKFDTSFTKGRTSNALDDCCCSAHSLATRNGQFLHAGRIHPHFAGAGGDRRADPDYSRPQRRLDQQSLGSLRRNLSSR